LGLAEGHLDAAHRLARAILRWRQRGVARVRGPVPVAGDGLHPSGAQYTLWVEGMAPVVEELLGR